METLRNIVIVGASGMIGSSILKALQQTQQYNITIFTRSAKSHTLPLPVRVMEVDYSSFDSLVQALQGQDVLISALGKFALENERLLIDAAFAANIKRVIPSEFGGNLLNSKTRALPNYKHKVDIEERLFELCQDQNASSMTYTLVFNNILLDWSLMSGFILDPRSREVRKYDEGDTLFSTTRTCTVGLAVARILQNYTTTANRVMYIQDIAITQNELLCLIQEEEAKIAFPELHHTSGEHPGAAIETSPSLITLGGNATRTLKITHIDTASLEEEAREEIARGAAVEKLFNCFSARAAFTREYGGFFEHNDNDMLGLQGLSREELREIIRNALL